MAELVAGLFSDSKKAGEAVADLKQRGFTDDISLIAKNFNDEGVNSHQIKQDVKDGAGAGAVTGGILGALGGLLVGAATLTVPVIGPILAAGPLAAALGGGAIGAATGGIVGALVDAGIPDQKAKMYEDRIRSGEVLVTVTVPEDKAASVQRILDAHSVEGLDMYHAAAM